MGLLESSVNQVTDKLVPTVINSIDIDELISQVDINELVAQVDIDQLLERVDINRIIERVDIQALIKRIDVAEVAEQVRVGSIAVKGGEEVATGTLDLLRRQLASADIIVSKIARRILRREKETELQGPANYHPRIHLFEEPLGEVASGEGQ